MYKDTDSLTNKAILNSMYGLGFKPFEFIVGHYIDKAGKTQPILFNKHNIISIESSLGYASVTTIDGVTHALIDEYVDFVKRLMAR